MNAAIFIRLFSVALLLNSMIFLIVAVLGLIRYYRATQTIDPRASGEEARPLLDVSPLKHLCISTGSFAILSCLLGKFYGVIPFFIILVFWLYAKKQLEE